MMPRTTAGRLVAPLASGFLLALAGCSTLRQEEPPPRITEQSAGAAASLSAPPAVPSKYSRRVGPFCFNADSPLDAEESLLAELAELREQVSRQLKLPEGTALVQVCLFDDQSRYEQFMHAKYRDLPRRRAFFVKQQNGLRANDLMVYTWRGKDLRQDLRHELTHATLHSVLKDVPMWLDEGLAEYFELPPEAGGVNQSHLRYLRSGGRPDLARLEQFSQVGQMDRPEYREAWAWVHLMLHGPPAGRDVLLAYLQSLRTNPSPGALLPKLEASVEDPVSALQDHLDGLAILGQR